MESVSSISVELTVPRSQWSTTAETGIQLPFTSLERSSTLYKAKANHLYKHQTLKLNWVHMNLGSWWMLVSPGEMTCFFHYIRG